MKFSKLWRDYVAWLGHYKGSSPRTCENYELAYGQFLAFLKSGKAPGSGAGNLEDDVKNFNPDTVQAFAEYLSAGGNAPNSVNTKLAALGSLAKYGMRVKDGKKYVLPENPLDRVERPQRQRVTRKFLYGNEMAQLNTAECSANERVALDIIRDTAVRVSGLVKADVEDFQDADGTFVLMIVPKGRGRQSERVPKVLSETTSKRLYELLRHREAGPKEPLLVNTFGKRYSRTVLSTAIARIAKRAGVTRFRVGAHTIRHTWNVVARVEAGLDGPQRAGGLDQTDVASATKYDHLLPRELVETARKVQDGMMRYAQ